MNPVDAALVASDPHLPGLALALDEHRLLSELRGVDPQIMAERSIAVRRVRYKPGIAVLAAIEVTHPELPSRWFRLAGYRRGNQAKLHKDLRSAAQRGGLAGVGSGASAWCLIEAFADRHLRADRLRRYGHSWNTIAYNPSRRLVSAGIDEHGQRVVAKTYRRGHLRIDPYLRDSLVDAGVAMPELLVSRVGQRKNIELSAFVDGVHPDPRVDGEAVAHVISAMHNVGRSGAVMLDTDGRENLESSIYPTLVERARRALDSVIAVLPSKGPLVETLFEALEEALSEEAATEAQCDGSPSVPITLIHGDLSTDQVIMRTGDRIPVLLDLDLAGPGPIDWDAATWHASQIATGIDVAVPLPGRPPRPLMVAAALAIRSPEPFQRRRRGWDRIITKMLEESLAMVTATLDRSPFIIRRAWPTERRIVLELVDRDGAIVPGMTDVAPTVGSDEIDVGTHGNDQALPAVAELLARGGVVIGHRFGRRAVLRLGDRYAKVLRPRKLHAAVSAHQSVQRALETRGADREPLIHDRTARAKRNDAAAGSGIDLRISVPRLIDVDHLRSIMWFDARPGHPVLASLGSGCPVGTVSIVGRSVGEALRQFSMLEIDDLGTHDVGDEIRTMTSWQRPVDRFSILPGELARLYHLLVDQVCAELEQLRDRPTVVAHRDFHDGQILIDGGGPDGPVDVTLLDLDTVTLADPTLDAGNLLAHVDLAVCEGRLDDQVANRFARDFLAGRQLDPMDLDAVNIYKWASAVRIIAVHAFRPSTRPAALRLLQELGAQQPAHLVS